ncbi:MAG: glycosyltransferase [Flavobacteriales bacterium]
MKLVVLLSRVPYPLEKGDKLRAYHQVRLLAERHEVHLICLDDKGASDSAKAHLQKIVKSLHIIPLNKALIAWNMLRAMISEKPFQVHYFTQMQAVKKVNRLIGDIKPDHIYCQLIRTAEYVKQRHDIPKTLDYMDALNAGVRRRVEGTTFIKKYFIKEEAQRLVRYENIIFDYFDHHTIISSQDRELIFHKDRQKIEVIPNGVDSDYFRLNEQVEPKFDIVFTGNMNYPPNIDGARRLALEILPLIKKKRKNITLQIAGATPAREVLELNDIEGVTVTGWVEDIRKSYANAYVFVAPMRIGSGLQNKLLEAMSMSLPCITSSLAANAFTMQQREAFMVADSNEEIAVAIERLLEQEALRKDYAHRGRKLIESDFRWAATIDLLEKVFNEKK